MNWDTVQNLLSNIIFALLMIAMISYWINLAFFNKTNLLFNSGRICSLLANGSLVFILCSRWIIAGYFPLSNLYESLLFLTCLLLSVYLYFEVKTKKKLIGAISLPLALLLNGFANLTLSPEMQKSSPLVPALQSNWLMLHVSMMLLSYAVLIMGSLLCILFLIFSKGKNINLKIDVEKQLRENYGIFNAFYKSDKIKSSAIVIVGNPDSKMSDAKKIELFFRLHKRTNHALYVKLLQFLDNWSYRIIGLGFPFLTMGIISGGVWANEAWGSYWSWDPKETWALITWLVFTSYLHARFAKGWTGKKAATLGGLGFFAIWICYLGVNFLGKGLHSYGWFS